MAQAVFHFPRGFLWGTATASYQVEGNNTNSNWYAWEQETGRILKGDKSGLACDWWNGRWREDLRRAAESGQNAHRFSVEWSRIQPAPERWDESAIDRYLEMLRYMEELGLMPMVTLHHFSDPLWLVEKGGWESPGVVDYFNTFVRRVVEALKDYANLWCTINEPNVLALSAYLLGLFPPGVQNIGAYRRVCLHLARSHAAAYHTIHDIQPEARVGMAINYRSIHPAHAWSPLDRWMSRLQANTFNDTFPGVASDGWLRLPFSRQRVPEAKGTQDYLGVNYYSRELVAFNLLRPQELFSRRFYREGVELSQNGFIANEPEGMWEALKWANRFKLPILVSENGVEDAEDRLRPRYLAEHLHQMWKAANFNWPVKGYLHWTLVDNFEWERGWSQRFGLWELDLETQGRRKRPSADFFAEICRENGMSAEMVARYAPEVFAQIFPN
jgi:beta-glucosidase